MLTVLSHVFLHAPAAWVGFMGFFLVAVASALYLWLEEERLDRIAESAAEVAVVFTAVAVTTGSLWARASWDTFWKWDPVPALTLALGVVYGVYMLLRTIIGDPVRRARVCAYLGIGGAVLVFTAPRRRAVALAFGPNGFMVSRVW